MGAGLSAWIEYDGANYHAERAGGPPFSDTTDGSIPLTDFYNLTGAKDYRFFAAISGARKRGDDPAPLFPLRGLPTDISGYTACAVDKVADRDDPNFGWLVYDEIEQALAHMNLTRSDLSLPVNIVLDLMQAIDRRLGEGQSRLIFYIN